MGSHVASGRRRVLCGSGAVALFRSRLYAFRTLLHSPRVWHNSFDNAANALGCPQGFAPSNWTSLSKIGSPAQLADENAVTPRHDKQEATGPGVKINSSSDFAEVGPLAGTRPCTLSRTRTSWNVKLLRICWVFVFIFKHQMHIVASRLPLSSSLDSNNSMKTRWWLTCRVPSREISIGC